MTYRTEFPRYISDKHLKDKKKVLMHSLEHFKEHNYVGTMSGQPVVFKDDDEAYMSREGVGNIKYLNGSFIGKAFDVNTLGEDHIKIPVKKVGGLGVVDVPLWAVDRVLNYDTDPEYFI